MDNTVYSLDVKTAGCNIGCYNCMTSPLGEIINRLRALLLRHPTMYTSDSQSFVFHLISDPLYSCTSSTENETAS